MRVDLHCHLLPGIDDGCKTLEDSLALARGLVSLGYTHIAVTPHIRPGIWNNTPEIILQTLQRVQTSLQDAAISLGLQAGAEHFFDAELPERLQRMPGWGKQQKRYLVELSHAQPPPPMLSDILFRLRIKGVKVLLAHPERYRNPLSWVGPLREQGVPTQVSLTSLGGKFGKSSRELAQAILDADLVDLAATDAHRPDDIAFVEEGLRWIEKRFGSKHLSKLTEEAPRTFLEQ